MPAKKYTVLRPPARRTTRFHKPALVPAYEPLIAEAFEAVFGRRSVSVTRAHFDAVVTELFLMRAVSSARCLKDRAGALADIQRIVGRTSIGKLNLETGGSLCATKN